MSPLIARGLDSVTFKGSFQPKPFYDSMIFHAGCSPEAQVKQDFSGQQCVEEKLGLIQSNVIVITHNRRQPQRSTRAHPAVRAQQ